MTADVILCDFKGKTWTSEKRAREQELHRQAVEIANVAFPSVFGFSDGIDAFVAPESDPA